jgi:hypothetical protein
MTSMSLVSAQIESRRLHLGEDFLLEGACAFRPRCANSMARRQKTVGDSDAKVRRERLHRYNNYTLCIHIERSRQERRESAEAWYRLQNRACPLGLESKPRGLSATIYKLPDFGDHDRSLAD